MELLFFILGIVSGQVTVEVCKLFTGMRETASREQGTTPVENTISPTH